VAEPLLAFAGLLKKLRTDAGLTQEGLAEAAGLSVRSISDLERGINQTARKDTARLLADALNLTGDTRAEFVAIARGRPAVPVPSGPGSPAGVRTLPRDIGSFTGREPELREMVSATASRPGSVVGIHAIGGMAGVGKTAFAVHAAHRLADRFPAGQIFLPLHGHTPGQQPVAPADALASLLQTAGVSAAQIPPGLEARMALWRDRLVGQQLLLVLDDAASSDQVRPLLPGTGGSLVLVTSRRHLTALEDAATISLDTLPPHEAAELLIRLANRPGIGPDDPAVNQITRLCGYLPLAVGMLARQLHHHPSWTPADLASELAAARDRLDLMVTENLSVTAAFNLSYDDLALSQQRMFRRLGLHPGPDIDAYAAAALDGTDLVTARRHLEALYEHYLLTEPTRGRYRLHDLIRAHARALTARDDPDGDRDEATSRLLDYYQRAGEAADRLLTRYTRPGPAAGGPGRAFVPVLPDSTRALSWLRSEHANLLACLNQVTRTRQQARVVALTAAMAAVLQHDGPWAEAVSRHTTALGAAQALGDRLGEASARQDLGVVLQLSADYPGATRSLTAALGAYRDLGDRLGEANAVSYLGIVRFLVGDYAAAAESLSAALGLYRDVGDRLGEANALHYLGSVRRATGDYADAAVALDAALAISRDIEDRAGQANALRALGLVRYQSGEFPAAIEAQEAALAISRELGDRLGQATALRFLGSALSLTGHPAADATLGEALAISRDIGDRLGQASALTYLADLRRQTGDLAGAVSVLEEALSIERGLSNPLGEANVLTSLAIVRRETGDLPGAAEALEAALGNYRDIGDRGGEVEVLNEIATLHRVRLDLDLASAVHRQALGLARELDSAWDEAQALAGLARCALARGHRAEAAAGLREAVEIFQRIGAAEAAEASAELSTMLAV
jgi:tetratricopeptide (TPR) repeat protein/transcriptional regulator with XRE-family HTH domain